VNPGYWRKNDQTSDIIECSNASFNCLGGPHNSTCATGHIEPLCESCDLENDYSTAANFKCGSCGDKVLNSFKILGLFLFCVKNTKILRFYLF